MGYTKLSLIFIRDLIRKGIFENIRSVIELGSLDIQADYGEVCGFFDSLNLDYENEKLQESMRNDRIPAKILYEGIGIEQYKCIDTDGFHGCYQFDLNEDIGKAYGYDEKFDLVTNLGTGEHIFNQYAFFKNIHDLCKVNGFMLHGLPMQGFVNHGFYNYNPRLFYSLAKSNGYLMKGIWIADNVKNTIVEYTDRDADKVLKESYVNSSEGIVMLILLKKTEGNEFSLPFQGSYLELIQNDHIKEKYLSKNIPAVFRSFVSNRDIKGVAIFGTEKAGTLAHEFCKYADIKVICFIDDLKKGVFNDIPIVDWETFVSKYQKEVDFIIKGPYQRGSLKDRHGLCVEVKELLDCYF